MDAVPQRHLNWLEAIVPVCTNLLQPSGQWQQIQKCEYSTLENQNAKSKTFKSVTPEHIKVLFTTLFTYTHTCDMTYICAIIFEWRALFLHFNYDKNDMWNSAELIARFVTYNFKIRAANTMRLCRQFGILSDVFVYKYWDLLAIDMAINVCANNAFATEIQLYRELQIHKFAAHCFSGFLFVFVQLYPLGSYYSIVAGQYPLQCSVFIYTHITFTIQFGGLFPPDYILMRLNS